MDKRTTHFPIGMPMERALQSFTGVIAEWLLSSLMHSSQSREFYCQAVTSIFSDGLNIYLKSNDKIQARVRETAETLHDPDASMQQRRNATTALVNMLFPQENHFVSLDEMRDRWRAESPGNGKMVEKRERQKETFAKRLREQIEQKGLTQAELAEKADMTQPGIAMLLSRRCQPQQRTVAKLAAALGVSPEDLWPDFRDV